MLEMPDFIGCSNELNGDFQGSRSYYRMIIITTIMLKPEAIIFVVAHPYFLAKRTEPKKDKQTKNF